MNATHRLDNGPASDSTSKIDAMVAGVNDAPRPTQPLFAANAIQDITLDLALPEDLFIDVDSTDVQWSLRAGDNAVPSWLAFDPRTLTVRGTPRNRDVGLTLYFWFRETAKELKGKCPSS